MKPIFYKNLTIFFCIYFFFVIIPCANGAEEFSQIYDQTFITGFEMTDYEKSVDIEYKYALIELQKEFPSQVSIRLGGKVYFQEDPNGSLVITRVTDYITEKINVIWKCQENYDEELEVFHFVPEISGFHLAQSLDIPVITVNILGKLSIPPLNYIEDENKYIFPDKHNEITSKTILPSYYNNYENGNLPPIRNQNPYGTCWAFSTIASIEADLIHDNKTSTDVDLSELHLAYFTYHNFKDEKDLNIGDTVTDNTEEGYLDFGGSLYISGKSVSNMLGPVYESQVSYGIASTYNPDPVTGRNANFQITGVYVYDMKNDKDAVKNAIINHGAVSCSYFDSNEYYSATYHSYYNPDNSSTNHAIALVGWDDNFSRYNFREGTPDGNGAWLIRNSWGGYGYGHSSYFWISYYDQSLSSIAYAFDAEPWHYDHVYSYDNSPYDDYWYFYKGEVASQNFYVSAKEQIKAIGYYSEDSIENITFSIKYGNKTVNIKTVSMTDPGYYLIPLSTPITINSATEVTVQVTFSDDGISRVFTEYPHNYFNMIFSAQRGSGLRDQDGYLYENDARIKLFTDNLPDLILPANLTKIESEAFVRGAFKYVKLPEKTVSIGYRAFADCPNLTKIYIPQATTNISTGAFGNNLKLTIVGVPGSYAETYALTNGYGFMPVS